MAERYVIRMPQLSDTMTEGVLVSWQKAIGEKVSRGDVVAQVETDKAIMDVEVFREGYLSGPRVAEGVTVPVGEPIAYLVPTPGEVVDEEGTAPPSPEAPAPAPEAVPAAGPPAPPQSAAGEAARGDGGDQPPEGVVHVIRMPQLSDTMTEGVVVAWAKRPGEKVSRGDVVAQVETDKAVMDVEVFREGYLSGPLAPVDATVPVGEPIGYLVERPEQVVEAEAAPAAALLSGGTPPADRPAARETAPRPAAPAAPGPAPARPGAAPAPRPSSRYASPYARRLAGELGVNLEHVQGSGPGGVITGEDVLRARPAARPVETAPEHLPEVQVPGEGRPMTAMERAVARSMTAALTMPTFHVTVHARPDALVRGARRRGVSVTVALAKACAEAIRRHPRVNWAYQPGDRIVERDRIDIGMAVAADDGGLVVPVLRGCESRPLDELHAEWKGLVERARKRRLKPEEYASPTFMISNMGMLNVDWFDAIPTPGTAAILAVATAGERGMPLTVTADHRVVNGAEVAAFLNTLRELVERPDDWLAPPGPRIPEGEWDWPVVVIGGGPGGEDCARELAEHGIKVALVNDAPLPGGECLWRGCIPSKTWRAAADRIRDRAHDARLGVLGTARPRLDWKRLEATRREVLETRGAMALKTDKGMKVEVIQGRARFEDAHTLFIDTSHLPEDPHARPGPGDGSAGRRVTFGCAVIATGAPPFVPPIPGAREGLETGGVLTSDTVWSLEGPPKRMVVVGGGAIGAEMAQMFQDFGTRVLLLEARSRILAEVEPEIARRLAEVLAADPRLEVQVSVRIDRIEGRPGAMKVRWRDAEGKRRTTSCDRVLMATGKRPLLEPLQLDRAGVETRDGAIAVDDGCRTSAEHIYAVGDVVGGYMLAHTAATQGRVAAARILGERRRYDPDLDCGVIFTRPQAAFVGLSLEQAKARGLDAAEVKVPLGIDAKAMITGETEGLVKLVADKASHRIVGVHLLADHADTLVGEAVMMVAGRMTLEQVAEAVHPHPTQTELFGDLARRLLSRLRRTARARARS